MKPTPAPRNSDGFSFALWLGAAALGVIALVASIAAVGIALARTDGASSVEASGGGGAGGAETVQVSLGEFFVEPSEITVPAGTTLTVEVTNDGAMPHDLKLDGKTGTKMLDPGQSETVELGKIEADSQAWCTVPGHKEAGMVMDIKVEGAGTEVATGSEHGTETAAEGDFAVIDPQAEPGEDWVARDPVLQPAPGGTEHAIELHATETELEVAPGVTQMMWTFGDEVPGPTIRGKVGDVFTFTLINDGEIGHSIDFHASMVSWTDEMRTIEPGESLTYQFRANFAGAYMYHCGTNPTLHHIGNGMYGAIIIDPPNLQPVDKEFWIVQSELYLGPQGEPGDLTKMQNEEWDAVVFNGFWNQYKFSPIQVEPNERIRVWVINDGPSENSAFHIVGTVFDTVWKEGAYLLRPDGTNGGSQVLDLQPAQGGFVEFTFAEEGFYPMVTHKFANVGKGALGLFRAGDAELPGAASH